MNSWLDKGKERFWHGIFCIKHMYSYTDRLFQSNIWIGYRNGSECSTSYIHDSIVCILYVYYAFFFLH